MYQLSVILLALRPTRVSFLLAVLVAVGVGFWQLGRPLVPRVVVEHDPSILAVFSPDGRSVASVRALGFPDTVKACFLTVWDVKTGEKIFERDLQGVPVAIVFSPDGRAIACRYWDQIQSWDVSTGRELGKYNDKDKDGENHPQIVFSPDGGLWALREKCFLWNVVDNKSLKNLALDGESVLVKGSNTILVRAKGNTVKVWDLATATLCAELKDFPNEAEPLSAELTSNGRFLVTTVPANLGTSVSIYDFVTGQKHAFHEFYDNGIAISPDGKSVALGIWIWTASNPRSCWNSFANWLGTQEKSTGHFVIIRALPSGEEIIAIKGGLPVFSPDGLTLMTKSHDWSSLQLWDFPIRKPVSRILGFAGLAALATLLVPKGLGALHLGHRTVLSFRKKRADGKTLL
jgi:WD40 repeat protein